MDDHRLLCGTLPVLVVFSKKNRPLDGLLTLRWKHYNVHFETYTRSPKRKPQVSQTNIQCDRNSRMRYEDVAASASRRAARNILLFPLDLGVDSLEAGMLHRPEDLIVATALVRKHDRAVPLCFPISGPERVWREDPLGSDVYSQTGDTIYYSVLYE